MSLYGNDNNCTLEYMKSIDLILNTLEERRYLQSFLDVVKDKPLFPDKIDEIKAMLKTSNFATPVSE